MTKTRSTKKALLLSAFSLLICFSMLIGTTFAWFTDSVTSANNIIKSGNLDVELEYWDGDSWEDVEGKSDILTNELWEPGVTEVAYLRVANAGSLALKYQMGINIVSETAGKNVKNETLKLSDYIKFGVVENVNGETGAYANREAAVAAVTSAKKISEGFTKTASMTAGQELYLALVVYMPTTVGNEANHNGTNIPQIDLGINVFATQYTAENDSFGSDYDKDAVATIVSPSVALPASPQNAVEKVLETTTDNSVVLTLPAEFIADLVQMTDAPESVSLSHAEPKVDATNNMVVFEHIELVDENGDIIDLEAIGNDAPITVKFNVGDAFNVGDTVIVYHDGEIFATPVVDADKNVTYTATHFCEVTVGYNDGKIDTLLELDNTIKHANDGDTIVFGGDITSKDGILIQNKNLTIDLNGKTFTVSEGASTNNRNFKINGASEVTIKNGTMVAAGELTSGAYGTIRTEGTAEVTLDNVKLYSYRGYGLNVKANTGTKITINDSEIYAKYSGGVEAAGGEIVLNNVKIEQTGVYSGAAWCSVAIGVNGGGKVTVNSGNYSASAIATDANAANATWVAYVMSSGGTLNINGGTFNGLVAETASAANACGIICADRAAVVNIYGGTFNSNGAILDMRNNVGTQPNPVATIYGGTFSADPTVSGLYSSNLITVADGYEVVVNDDGKWVVAVEDLQTVINNATAGDTIVLNGDVTATSVIMIDKDIVIEGNGYKVSSTATRVFRVTATDVEVTLNNVNMVSNAVRVSSNDIRGISVDGDLTNISLTLNNCSVDFTDASAHDWAYAVNVTGGTGYTVIVNGGVYEGANAINIRGEGQTVVVKNATLTSLYQPSLYENMYGACIYVVQNANSSVEAVGNTFNGGNAVAINAGYTPVVKSDNVDNTTRA